jgi:hypothetical protein
MLAEPSKERHQQAEGMMPGFADHVRSGMISVTACVATLAGAQPISHNFNADREDSPVILSGFESTDPVTGAARIWSGSLGDNPLPNKLVELQDRKRQRVDDFLKLYMQFSLDEYHIANIAIIEHWILSYPNISELSLSLESVWPRKLSDVPFERREAMCALLNRLHLQWESKLLALQAENAAAIEAIPPSGTFLYSEGDLGIERMRIESDLASTRSIGSRLFFWFGTGFMDATNEEKLRVLESTGIEHNAFVMERLVRFEWVKLPDQPEAD